MARSPSVPTTIGSSITRSPTRSSAFSAMTLAPLAPWLGRGKDRILGARSLADGARASLASRRIDGTLAQPGGAPWPRPTLRASCARGSRANPSSPASSRPSWTAWPRPSGSSAVRSLGRSEQRRLYRAVDGFLPLRLVDLVPPGCADLETVRHFGRNTLPAFTLFEKRFCRPRGADARKPGELWGFNFQTPLVRDRAGLLRRARGSQPAGGLGRLHRRFPAAIPRAGRRSGATRSASRGSSTAT